MSIQNTNILTPTKQKGLIATGFQYNALPCVFNPASSATFQGGTAVKLISSGTPASSGVFQGVDAIYVDAAGDTDKVIGFIAFDLRKNIRTGGVPYDATVNVYYGTSFMFMEADEAIAVGADLGIVSASVRVQAAGVGQTVIGTALTASLAAGDIILVAINTII